MIFWDLANFIRWNLDPAQNRIFLLLVGSMAHFKNLLLRDVLCKIVYFLRYCTYLWVCGKHEAWGGAPAKTNYNCFYIFQNCIIRNFGRILNSLAILLICSSKLSWLPITNLRFRTLLESWTGILPSITGFMSTFVCILLFAVTRIYSLLSELGLSRLLRIHWFTVLKITQSLFSASVIPSKVK